MRMKRVKIFWTAGGLASGVLVASAWAQAPAPAPVPAGYQPPPPKVVCEEGPVRRAAGHTWRAIQNNFVGYPEEFIEPPLGFYKREIFSVMKAKADPHRFTLYKTDFLAGTSRLSPNGATRFNLIANRLRTTPLPVIIEGSPDQPGLAESRQAAVFALLQGTGLPVIPERVVIAPSIYPGLLGTDAANNYNAMSSRYGQAPTSYSLPPSSSGGSFSGGAP